MIGALIVIEQDRMFCSNCFEDVFIKTHSKKDPASGPKISHHGCEYPFVAFALQCEEVRGLAASLHIPEVRINYFSVPSANHTTSATNGNPE